MKMRSKKLQKIAALIVALPLLIWGFGYNEDPRKAFGNVTPIKVGKTAVPPVDIALYTASLPFGVADNAVIRDRITAFLVHEASVLDIATSIGLRISDNLTARTVHGMSMFVDLGTGRFDKELPKRYATRLGVEVRDIVEYVRRDLIRRTFAEAVNPLSLPDETHLQLGEKILKRTYRTRKIAVIDLESNPELNKTQPDNAALTAFYNAAPERFRRAEKRRISFTVIDAEAVRSQVKISDDQVREAFEQTKAKLTVPEKRTLRQYLFKDRQSAQAMIDSPKNYKSEGRIIGTFAESEVPKDAAEVFKNEVGKLSAPIRTATGYAVYAVTKIKPEAVPQLAAHAAAVRERLVKEEAVRAAAKAVETAQEDAAGGNPPEAIAARLQLRPARFEGDKSAAAEHPAQVTKAWFGATQDGETRVVESNDGRSYFYRVENITPAYLPAFADTAEEVKQAYLKDAADKTVREQAEALVLKLHTGEVRPENDDRFRFVNLTPKGVVQGLSQELQEQLRTARTGVAVQGVFSGKRQIAMVTALLPTRDAPLPSVLGREWSASFGDDVISAAVQARNLPVSINAEALTAALRSNR